MTIKHDIEDHNTAQVGVRMKMHTSWIGCSLYISINLASSTVEVSVSIITLVQVLYMSIQLDLSFTEV
jgi:hypothetical protein